ncbi:DUF2076 domain-containing protein [Sabulicella rubraurantiaca]|uniref:DUF2076 domain-containing protein n=1 Tax=Sabulicella rubraurantiaca TaxID=2811429 RepID=UPI001A96F93A|nr:DUF2076 domain-containing protein [Sabulicella rubraurantiaca]
MTEEERRIITEYVQRVAGVSSAAPSGGPWNSGRVPSTGQGAAPNLPPVDPDADRLIGELFQRHPEARYRLTQTAFVQEHALVQAQNRIQELEWELENSRRQAEAASNRGFFGLGGSRPAPMPPRPQPVQAPGGMNPAMMGRQGPGFLGTAMMTAAGVAGGMVLGNMLMNAFGGGGAAAAATSAGAGAFGTEAVPTSSAWTDPGSASGFGGNDATPAGYDDASGGYDDAAGGYDDGDYGDEEI